MKRIKGLVLLVLCFWVGLMAFGGFLHQNIPTVNAAGLKATSYTVSYNINSDWGSGAAISVSIKNTGTTAISGWNLAWTFPGNQKITAIWNATHTQTDTAVTVQNAVYNKTIAAGATLSFGFITSYSGTNSKPTSFTMNGISTSTPTATPAATPTPSVTATVTATATPTVTSIAAATSAATYYVSPNGNDSNAGTYSAPFKSITAAQAAAASGDTVYLRGGTYNNFTIAGSDSNYYFVHNITKSGITYKAYDSEIPIFNFSGVSTTKRVAAFHIAIGVTNVTFEGFTVTGVPVGSQKQSECFRIEGNATFNRVTCCNNAANGFYFTTKGSGSCTYCDAYNNLGTTSTATENTDGFGAHAYGVTFKYCRAWYNSDDGFDCIASYAANTFDHCWAYNMTAGGNSNGFKIGGWGTATPPSSVPVHIVKYCLAACNDGHGFYANHHPGQAATWTYNTAYNNGHGNFNMLERVSVTDSTDIAGTREVLHYNIAYQGISIESANLPAANVTNNSWTKSGVSVSAADFQSTDASQMTKARAADGSLPTITFMRLTSGSDLTGLGCF